MIETIRILLNTPVGLILQFGVALVIFLPSIYGVLANTLMLGSLRQGNSLIAAMYVVVAVVSGYFVSILLMPVMAVVTGFF